jgi:hypothetical protein
MAGWPAERRDTFSGKVRRDKRLVVRSGMERVGSR